MLSPSDDRTAPSSTPVLHISESDISDEPIYATQIVSSPTIDIRRSHHRIRAYRSDSMESTERLGPGEMTRDMTLVAESRSSHLSLDLSSRLSHDGTMISSPICAEDPEIPVLTLSQIYPAAPEVFLRHKKRRKM